ncbi:hypothetical protein J4419_04455 [Candidatus Woesearchaeota archaeon]|nr:hypothetical protein [Candidatus Woesearchaeota archaeon]
MNLVVDSNVLFTFFWKNSLFRKLLSEFSLTLFAPEYALVELREHRQEIAKKSGVSSKAFDRIQESLAEQVTFVPLELYQNRLKEALSFAPDPDDVDFFALAVELGLPLWSNDARLKSQKKVAVLSTEQVLMLLGSS